jgi:hypothetical protein
VTKLSLLGAAPLVLLMSACDFLTGPGERVMGIIGTLPAAEVSELRLAAQTGDDYCRYVEIKPPSCALEAPDSVYAGTPFQIVVRTSGPGGCWQPDGADVSLSGLAAEVVPYDRVVGPNCLDVSRLLSRTLSLTFEEPGEALIRVTGRVLILGDGTEEELIGSHDHVVVVR